MTSATCSPGPSIAGEPSGPTVRGDGGHAAIRGGRRSDGPGRRHRGRARTAFAFLAAVTLSWGCDQGRGLVEPSAGEPEPGFLAVELTAPAGARLSGAWLAIDGPDIGVLRGPGSEVFESDDGTGREVIVAGPALRRAHPGVPRTRSEARFAIPGPPDRGHGRGLPTERRVRLLGADLTLGPQDPVSPARTRPVRAGALPPPYHSGMSSAVPSRPSGAQFRNATVERGEPPFPADCERQQVGVRDLAVPDDPPERRHAAHAR